jgi:hypothetical protein
MSRPTNPDAFWNRSDGGRALPRLAHVIKDIRMGAGEYWISCTCGFYATAPAAADTTTLHSHEGQREDWYKLPNGTGLAEVYARHIYETKHLPQLMGGD